MIYCLNIKASLFICKRKAQLEYKMPQNHANKHLFGITDVKIFFSHWPRWRNDFRIKKERENERKNEWEREREIKETNKKKTTDKSTTFKLHRNPTRSYIKPLDQLLRRKIKSSVNSPSISKTVVIWCKSCLFNRMISLRRLIADSWHSPVVDRIDWFNTWVWRK